MCVTHVPHAYGNQKRASDSVKPELWIFVSCHRVLGTKPSSPAWAAVKSLAFVSAQGLTRSPKLLSLRHLNSFELAVFCLSLQITEILSLY